MSLATFGRLRDVATKTRCGHSLRWIVVRAVVASVVACSDATGPLTDPHGLFLVIRGAGKTAEIYAMRSDGSETRQLTRNSVLDATPDWSPDGSHIVFIRVQDSIGPELWVMNADGSGQRRLVGASISPEHPRWSPDGSRIAFEADDPSVGMFRPYIMNADGSNAHALSSSAGDASSVEWSPNGTQLLFLSSRAAPEAMYLIQTDGSGERQLSDTSACHSNVGDARWSPDATRIVYTCYESGVAIYTIRADGTGRVLLTTSAAYPVWSPDGNQIAFSSTRNGGADVYVIDPSSSSVTRVTHDGVTYGPFAWGGGR